MDVIEVSHEMTTLVGSPGQPAGPPPVPADAMAIVFRLGFAGDEPPMIHLDLAPSLPALIGAAGEGRIVFLVAREAVQRIGGRAMLEADGSDFHLPTDLRAIAMVLREPSVSSEARVAYQLAKSIELLCETIRCFEAHAVVPLTADAALSLADTRRILLARTMIDERWSEKLTLDGIARACGLNRAKLTRGFREMFECTIAEALAERRLMQASKLLLTTDLPVSSVGYEAGYLNNASFARAFGRHFGRSPSHYRASGMVAAA